MSLCVSHFVKRYGHCVELYSIFVVNFVVSECLFFFLNGVLKFCVQEMIVMCNLWKVAA